MEIFSYIIKYYEFLITPVHQAPITFALVHIYSLNKDEGLTVDPFVHFPEEEHTQS